MEEVDEVIGGAMEGGREQQSGRGGGEEKTAGLKSVKLLERKAGLWPSSSEYL